MRISAGASQVVSANRPPGARTRALSATASSGTGEVWEPEVADHSVKGSVLEREATGRRRA